MEPFPYNGASSGLMGGNSAGRTAFHVAMQAKDTQSAVAVARKALECGHPEHPLRDLANVLAEISSLANRRESITWYREVLELLPPGHPDISTARDDLANALREIASSVNDHDESISLHREALDLRPPGHPNRLASLDGLSGALLKKGSLGRIRESYPLLREALLLHPPSDGNHQHTFFNLSESLQGIADTMRHKDSPSRFQEFQELIPLLREALDILPTGYEHRAVVVQRLVFCLQDIGSIDDMREVILLGREMVELSPPGDRQRPTALYTLAYALTLMYDVAGKLPDLEESIALGREHFTLRPQGRYGLSNLAMSLHFLPENRDESLTLIQQAIPRWPPKDPRPFDNSRVLATIFFFYYEHTGAVEQLRHAASRCERALSLCSPNHCCRPKLVALKSKIDTALSVLPSSRPVPYRGSRCAYYAL